MATKPQAKAAIDAAAIDSKADIDNIIPVGANIKAGFITFGPTNYQIVLDAGGNAATASSWFTTIQNNLTAATRVFTVDRTDRRKNDTTKEYSIFEAKLTIKIINF